MLTPPVLSRLDLDTNTEGSVDPLSLQAVYERLADRVLPAVTVRMSRIRFVTSMCVAARVCQGIETEVAKDGVTPPWLVFEWFVIEAMVRMGGETDDMSRIPGALKVGRCVRNKRPVSNASYLKTPKVFGFSGIFRRLATTLGILTEELDLDGVGIELLRRWEVDQGLEGFFSGSDASDGPGVSLRTRLRKAVDAGLDAGSTVARPTAFWRDVATSLQPGKIGRGEKAVLFAALRGHGLGAAGKTGFGAEVVDALIAHGQIVERGAQPAFIRRLIRKGSKDLATHLSAIDAYEGLCAPITAAFDLVRHLSTTKRFGAITADEFARCGLAPRIVARLVRACDAVAADSQLLAWEPEVRGLLATFGEVRSPEELFESVIKRHLQAQEAKQPEPRRPWLERGRSGVSVRAPYPCVEPPAIGDRYVHDYRMGTMSRFLRDLGRVK